MKYNADKKPQRGQYFNGNGTRADALPLFEDIRGRLPQPVVAGREHWLGCYWYAMETACANVKHPAGQSGFISDFVDGAFNQDLFLWDTVFITMFADMATPWLPGITALDNFYVKQLPDGEIPRELVRDTGEDVDFWVNFEGLPLHSYFHNNYGYRKLRTMQRPAVEDMYFPDLQRKQTETAYYTLDNLNHPLLAWGEWVSYLHTGDILRLAKTFLPLLWQYRFMRSVLRHANGLYVTDWASMDNSPRNKDLCCAVDTSCEMVLFANNLLDMLGELERHSLHPKDDELRQQIAAERDETIEAINSLMWDEQSGFYYDIKADGSRGHIKTAAAFWALAAGVAADEQAQRLVAWLDDEATFNRLHRLPVLAADEPGYDPRGNYWSGSIWSPIEAMVVYGLEKYGYGGKAREIGLNHMDSVAKVWESTGTIWENYPADSLTSGDSDHPDFVGWSGMGPIRFLLRYGIGLAYNAPEKKLVWTLDKELLNDGELGCKGFGFGGCTTSLLANVVDDGVRIVAEADKPYRLRVLYDGMESEFDIEGSMEFKILRCGQD